MKLSLKKAYLIFGLSPPTTKAVIKSRYFELALLTHPDKAGPDSKATFQDIQAAYEKLVAEVNIPVPGSEQPWGDRPNYPTAPSRSTEAESKMGQRTAKQRAQQDTWVAANASFWADERAEQAREDSYFVEAYASRAYDARQHVFECRQEHKDEKKLWWRNFYTEQRRSKYRDDNIAQKLRERTREEKVRLKRRTKWKKQQLWD